MSQNNQSFNESELSKGLHLLTDSSHNVKVNTPSVPPHSAHLYPRLAGSNWTSYLSQPRIILGRSGTDQQKKTSQKNKVDIDFEDCKAISRKHCEIRYSARRDRWELYVHGRNGVKLDHVLKKPRDKPSVLKTSDLIELNETSFLFVLPDNYKRPVFPNQQQQTETRTTESEVNTPNEEDQSIDQELEAALVSIIEKNGNLTTKDITEKLKDSYSKPVDKESVLHFLVLSSRFEVTANSKSMSSKEADLATWTLAPSTANSSLTEAPDSDADVIKENSSKDDIPNSTTASNIADRRSNPLTRQNTSIRNSFTAPSSSFSRLFDDDGDWSVFVPNSPPSEEVEDQQTETQDSTNSRNVHHTKPPPKEFGGLSIESIYSMWSRSYNSTSYVMEDANSVDRPNKRLRQMSSTSNMLKGFSGLDVDDSPQNNPLSVDTFTETGKDIFKEVHTNIVYNEQ